MSDALNSGRWFRVLAVGDDFTRECLALVMDTSLSGLRVGRELDRITGCRGRPAMIVSDNGTGGNYRTAGGADKKGIFLVFLKASGHFGLSE